MPALDRVTHPLECIPLLSGDHNPIYENVLCSCLQFLKKNYTLLKKETKPKRFNPSKPKPHFKYGFLPKKTKKKQEKETRDLAPRATSGGLYSKSFELRSGLG